MEDFKFNNIPSQGTFGKAVSTANKNFELAWVAINGLEYATRKNKGLFATLNDLKASVPSPKQGEWALVGSSFPCAVYRVDKNGQWVYSGTYEGDNIALNDYVTMTRHESDMADLNESIDEVRTAVYGSSVEQEVTFTEAIQIRQLAETIPAGAKVYLSGDVTSLMCRTANTDATYQTITSGTVADRAINYVTCGATPGTVTITAVIDKGLIGDVEALSGNLTSTRQEFENKLRGVGQGASATLYPVLNLGDFANIGDVNTALNTAFNTIGNDGKQGRLRLTRNGQVIFCDQFAIDYSVGRWAQMAYGMVAPSADGSVLVQATDHPHIVWRMNGADSAKWHELAGSISLKTINGKSLIGEGDITISEAAQIVIDTQLDPTSPNAVANSVVAAAYETLVEAIWQVMEDHDVITCAVWGATQPATAPDGTYAWDTVNKQLYLRKNSVWSLQEKSGNAIYINAIDNTSWRWNGTDMTTLSGNGISISDTVTENDPNPVSGGAVFEALSGLSSEIESKGAGVLPFGGIVEGDIDIEREGYSDEGGTVKYNDAQTMFVLEVPTGALTRPLYYQSWSETATRKPSTSYNEHLTARENVLYSLSTIASSGDKLGLYMFNGSELVEASPNLKTINNESILGEGNITIQGGGGDVAEDDDETLYPEYYGAKGDGINYYDWPLRCFNGTVEIPSGNIESSVYNANVFAPSENITWRYAKMPDFIATDQVVYNTVTKEFLLTVVENGVTKYYNQWSGDSTWENTFIHTVNGVSEDDREYFVPYCGSSAEWNDERNGTYKARTDVLFSDIARGGTSTKRHTYIFKNDELVDYLTTMTNDYAAIMTCIAQTKGNMRLHRGKIYFMINSSTESYTDMDNFVTDGQGATIFCCSTNDSEVLSEDTDGLGKPGIDYKLNNYPVFTITKCRHCVIKNINMRALRDRNNGCPSGHHRFSSSCSREQAFALTARSTSGKYVSDMYFENVTFKGFYTDIEMDGANVRGIVVNGWKSEDLGASEWNGPKDITIRNFDITQMGFCAGGMHIVYGQEGLQGISWSNGRFDTSAPFAGVGLTYHGGNATTQAYPRDIHYSNVTFNLSRLGQAAGKATEPQWQHFYNCELRQKFSKIMTDNEGFTYNVSGLFIGTNGNWDFNNCRISLLSSRFMTISAKSSLFLIMRNCGIYTQDLLGTSQSDSLVLGFTGTFITEGCWHNWPGPTGVDFTKTENKKFIDLKEEVNVNKGDIEEINSALYGDAHADYETDENGVYPLEADLGDYVRNKATGYVEQCTEKAVQGRITLQCNTPTGAAIDGSIIVYTRANTTDEWSLHAEASLTAGQGEVSTAAGLGELLRSSLANYGYTCGRPNSSHPEWVSVLSAVGKVIGRYNANYIKIEATGNLSGLIVLYTTNQIAQFDGVDTTNGLIKYYKKGSIGKGIAVEEGGLVNQVDTLVKKKASITAIALWDDNYQAKSDWKKGDYWYAPTEGELKVCTSEQGEFEYVTDILILAYQSNGIQKLYIWYEDHLMEVTLSNI